jgi:hypothetical protein
VNTGLTSEGVAALAPDAKVAAAGKKLGAPKSWQTLGRNQEALWGECRGSAVYQVRVDLSDLAVKCSCPSRKQPCKHVIGLLFLSLEATPSETSSPDWVTDWLARRAARTTGGKRSKRRDEAAASDLVARERREKRRLSRISAGLDALDLWMEDLMRRGLAAAGTQPPSFWEEQAKRMVDAQAPGVAARLWRLSGLPNSSPDWPGKLLDGLGRLALLSKAFSRLDVLDDPLVESVRAEVGISLPQEEVLERGERVDDRWIVLGQRTEEEGRLTVRRTWLLGEDTRRYALVLHFAAAGSPFAEGFVSGTKWRGEIAFYPGAYPLRAVVRTRSGGGDRCEGLPGHETVEALLDHTSKATALQPWLERLPAALRGVVPVLDGGPEGGRWLIRDRAGQALPLAGGEYWTLLSMSGGWPVDLAVEWDGEGLIPLGVAAGGTYRILAEEG